MVQDNLPKDSQVEVEVRNPIDFNSPKKPWKLSLSKFLLGGFILLFMPVLLIGGWLTYVRTDAISKEYAQAHSAEVSKRIYEKVHHFFQIPKRVVRYNAEQIQSGVLDVEDKDALMRQFLLQIRQEPLLTFVSVGFENGEYFGGARPPLGTNRDLRIAHSKLENDLTMQLWRINENAELVQWDSSVNHKFDARTRPWYVYTKEVQKMGWYPVYKYNVQDKSGNFTTLGMGVASPLWGKDGQFLGVTTADLALSQLGDFLAEITGPHDGVAFIADQNGDLLAGSDILNLFDDRTDSLVRCNIYECKNKLLQSAGIAMRKQQSETGNLNLVLDKGQYILHWQTLTLKEGPTLWVGVIFPAIKYMSLSHAILRNNFHVILSFAIASILLIILINFWVSNPLKAVSQSSAQLAKGQWEITLPKSGPIEEVSQLFSSMHNMALQMRNYTENLENLVADRTNQLEQANQRLSELSITDPLTHLANRRRFDEVLSHEWFRGMRSRKTLSLILVDVDHFKLYNDHYGHQAGDVVLKKVAGLLKEQARRPGDLAIRYGGEEFALIAAETDAMGARLMAEAFRHSVELMHAEHKYVEVGRLTVSVGVCSLIPESESDPDRLFRLADKALYRAKEEGRNRVVFQDVNQQVKPESLYKIDVSAPQWDDSFCCGNDVIDADHKKIFEMAAQLLILTNKPDAKNEILQAMEVLLQEVKIHFAHEESILHKYELDDEGYHAETHSTLLRKARQIADTCHRGSLQRGIISDFLISDVILRHIMEEISVFKKLFACKQTLHSTDSVF
jgi:diguanylate cyclase (GGDEF)-like protein/hemerythrin-like metal-binding protein